MRSCLFACVFALAGLLWHDVPVADASPRHSPGQRQLLTFGHGTLCHVERVGAGFGTYPWIRRCHAAPVPRPTPRPTPAPIQTMLPACYWPSVRQWSAQIYNAARITGLPAGYIAAVITTESGGQPYVSSQGYGTVDVGLMQFGGPESAIVQRTYGYGGYSYDPATNILTGSGYLRYLRDYYAHGNLYLAAEMYNGGVAGYAYGAPYAARVFSYWCQ